MEQIIFPEMAEYDVACHTKGCENQNIVIRLNADKTNPYVICGACSQLIEDVTKLEEEK